jgi:hypothetical protein
MTNSELKSKVVTLGNKLAPRMGDRRVAFVEAWAIVKRVIDPSLLPAWVKTRKTKTEEVYVVY